MQPSPCNSERLRFGRPGSMWHPRNAEERCQVNCGRTKSPVHLGFCEWRTDDKQFARSSVPNRFGYENNSSSVALKIVSFSRRAPISLRQRDCFVISAQLAVVVRQNSSRP
jgi:hypothetical protein